VQPRLEGEVRQVINGDQVHVEVATVVNPREARNVSGTMSLELWALPAPYAGGRFEGAPLAGVVLGTLAGHEQWHGLAFDLAYTPPGPGTWHPVVMLREWIGNGYVTRDFVNVGAPLVIAPPAPIEATPVVVAPVNKVRTRKPVAVTAVPPKGKKKSTPPKA
jgi:hypothetical protein